MKRYILITTLAILAVSAGCFHLVALCVQQPFTVQRPVPDAVSILLHAQNRRIAVFSVLAILAVSSVLSVLAILAVGPVLTMVNAAYVYRKTVGQRMAVVNLKYLSALMEVLPMDNAMLQQAIYAEGPDFEDLLQGFCAANAGCDFIITRNGKDYAPERSLLSEHVAFPPVMTPMEFLTVATP